MSGKASPAKSPAATTTSPEQAHKKLVASAAPPTLTVDAALGSDKDLNRARRPSSNIPNNVIKAVQQVGTHVHGFDYTLADVQPHRT